LQSLTVVMRQDVDTKFKGLDRDVEFGHQDSFTAVQLNLLSYNRAGSENGVLMLRDIVTSVARPASALLVAVALAAGTLHRMGCSNF